MIDVRDRTVEGVVLKAKDYRDSDRLLTLVTEDGPEAVIARGARKSSSSLASCSQTFGRISATLSPAKGGVSFLREARLEESFLPPAGDTERFAYLSYVAELLLVAWPPGRSAPELYGLTLAACTLFKLDSDLFRSARFLEVRLLDALGLLPPLARCWSCDRSLDGCTRFLLSPALGALLCASCAAKRGEQGYPLSAGAVRYLERLRSVPLNKLSSLCLTASIGAELEAALNGFLDYHLEYAGRARRILKQLL